MVKEKGDKWEDYEEMIDEQIQKEWSKCKPSSRCWQKIKVICFNEDGKPIAMKTDAYRKMMDEKAKNKIDDSIKP